MYDVAKYRSVSLVSRRFERLSQRRRNNFSRSLLARKEESSPAQLILRQFTWKILPFYLALLSFPIESRDSTQVKRPKPRID
jgi:hypothetical protein